MFNGKRVAIDPSFKRDMDLKGIYQRNFYFIAEISNISAKPQNTPSPQRSSNEKKPTLV